MIATYQQVIKIPYVFIVITIIPIFLIAFFIPPIPTNSAQIAMDRFLSDSLFDTIGFWTSIFPYNSKLITNYISLFGPVFSIMTYLMMRRSMIIDASQYRDMTVARYVLLLMAMIGLIFFVIYAFYMQATDIGVINQKQGVFGRHIIAYAIFSSGIVLAFHCFPIVFYSVFYFIPKFLLKKYSRTIQKSSQEHSGQ